MKEMKDKTPYLFGAVFGAFAILLVTIGAQNIVQQHTVIQNWHGSHSGPPDKVTEYNGFGAIRVGMGEIAGGVLLGGIALLIGSSARRRQLPERFPKSGMLMIASLATMAICFFPPWQMFSDISVVVFYLLNSIIIAIGIKETRNRETCEETPPYLSKRVIPAVIITSIILSLMGLNDVAVAAFAALFLSVGIIICIVAIRGKEQKSGEPTSAGDVASAAPEK